jgi:hypothetical protein
MEVRLPWMRVHNTRSDDQDLWMTADLDGGGILTGTSQLLDALFEAQCVTGP